MQLLLFPLPADDRDEQVRLKVEADLDHGPERDEPDLPEDE